MNISDGSSIYPDGKVFGRFQFVQESPGVAITSIFVLTMASIIGIFYSVPEFFRGIACLCTISCVKSLGSIVLMSFSRYVSICHHHLYNKIFKKSTCFVMCFCLYMIGLLLVLLNFVGIGDHSFNRKSSECIRDRLTTYYYTVFFTVFFVWTQFLVTRIFYVTIFLKFRGSSKRIPNATSHAQEKRPLYLAKTLFLIYTAFALCWILYAVLMVADCGDSLS